MSDEKVCYYCGSSDYYRDEPVNNDDKYIIFCRNCGWYIKESELIIKNQYKKPSEEEITQKLKEKETDE